MASVEIAPLGAPCWADLWTSDVHGSRSFYSETFGWKALEPNPEFGGYFQWHREGAPVAGGMGDMGDMKANDAWKVYLQTPDAAQLAEVARAQGAEVMAEPSPVAELGTQVVVIDPTGAVIGGWEPGSFQGFAEISATSAPSWFELQTDDYAKAVAFYEAAFGWETAQIGDTDEFRYTVMLDPNFGGELAGIMDASGFLAGAPSHWSVYWQVEDVEATIAAATGRGGRVVDAATQTPYGTLATLADPAGAQFKLRTPPAS
jgi:uncharacterized protein